jgi:hypothetical protein
MERDEYRAFSEVIGGEDNLSSTQIRDKLMRYHHQDLNSGVELHSQ